MHNYRIRTFPPERAKEHFEAELAFSMAPVEVNHLRQEQMDNLQIIDVRSAEDYAKGHVPGAINLPEERWNGFVGLRKDLTNVFYCYSIVCPLAKRAAAQFAGQGFPVVEMKGGYEYWVQHHLPVESGSGIQRMKNAT